MKTTHFKHLLVGDYVVIFSGFLLVIFLFKTLWQTEQAAKLQVRQGDKVFGTFSLNQDRVLKVTGPLGVSSIEIKEGKARFVSSPCANQYCVHQGWLHHAGQAAICLPNRVSLELLGAKKSFDSLNY